MKRMKKQQTCIHFHKLCEENLVKDLIDEAYEKKTDMKKHSGIV